MLKPIGDVYRSFNDSLQHTVVSLPNMSIAQYLVLQARIYTPVVNIVLFEIKMSTMVRVQRYAH